MTAYDKVWKMSPETAAAIDAGFDGLMEMNERQVIQRTAAALGMPVEEVQKAHTAMKEKDYSSLEQAVIADSLPEGATLLKSGEDGAITIVGGSPRNGMSFQRLQDVTTGRGEDMTEDEHMEVATRARRGGKSALLLTQLAAMSMATMPELFRAGAVTGTTRTRVGGFFGGTGNYGPSAYDSYDEDRAHEREKERLKQAKEAMSAAELKRQRRMERNLKNVQRNS